MGHNLFSDCRMLVVEVGGRDKNATTIRMLESTFWKKKASGHKVRVVEILPEQPRPRRSHRAKTTEP